MDVISYLGNWTVFIAGALGAVFVLGILLKRWLYAIGTRRWRDAAAKAARRGDVRPLGKLGKGGNST